MHIEHIVIFAIALFVLIVASKPLADLLKIPEALVLLVLGATVHSISSVWKLLTRLSDDRARRYYHWRY